mmetsp:Transcript_4904/g.17783  ORF Transcript_4904/g.17783 Transcript_4904/m.17783 type:complete len:215 (+) Transcript_4904:170-814(+)
MTAWPSLYDEDRSVPAWAQGIQGRLDGCRQEPQVENQEAYSDPQFFKREWEREIAKEEMELQTARKQHHKEAKEMMKKQKENERSKVAANVQEIKKKRFVVMDDCRDLIRTQTGLPVMATKHKDIKYEVDAAASQNLCNLSIFNVNPSLASSYARSEQKMILPAQERASTYGHSQHHPQDTQSSASTVASTSSGGSGESVYEESFSVLVISDAF